MSYVDLHLRAEDEATLAAALDALLLGGHGIAVDIIGELTAATGEMVIDPETGEAVALTAPLSGWHANLRIRDDHPDREAIERAVSPLLVTPANPRRVWA